MKTRRSLELLGTLLPTYSNSCGGLPSGEFKIAYYLNLYFIIVLTPQKTWSTSGFQEMIRPLPPPHHHTTTTPPTPLPPQPTHPLPLPMHSNTYTRNLNYSSGLKDEWVQYSSDIKNYRDFGEFWEVLGQRQNIFEMVAEVMGEEPRATMLNRWIRSRNPGKQAELVDQRRTRIIDPPG